MEPRSIAYISEDPAFRDDIYESGKDAYIELGGLAFKKEFEEMYTKAGFTKDENGKWVGGNYKQVKQMAEANGTRRAGKTGLIATIYGETAKALAQRNNMRTEVMEKVRDGMMGNWKKVAQLRQHKTMYQAYTDKYVEACLGDRVTTRDGASKAQQQGVNYSNQGYSSLCASASFWLCYHKMREMGIDGYCEGIVHDSTTGNVPINKLFEVYLVCQRWFRQYIKDRFNMDYKK